MTKIEIRRGKNMSNEKIYPKIVCAKCKKEHNNAIEIINNSEGDPEKPDTYIYECPCGFQEEMLVSYEVYVVGKRNTKRINFQ